LNLLASQIGDPPFFTNSSTIKARCSSDHAMVYCTLKTARTPLFNDALPTRSYAPPKSGSSFRRTLYICLIQVQLDVLYTVFFISFVVSSTSVTDRVPNQYLLQWNNTPNHTNLWLCAAVVLLMMGANSTRNM
jgi:hypothetical protein